MALDALVFDLDGTLIDSTPGIGVALSEAFRTAGRVMPETDLRTVIGPPITVIARRLEPSLSDSEVAIIERTYRALYDSEGWRNSVPFDAVGDTLTALHERGLRLFIVTNKPLLPASNILAHLGLNTLFIEVLTRDMRIPHYGSKAAMLADLLDRQRLTLSGTLMIGDTSEDQEAAHANSVGFLHASYGYGRAPGARSINQFSQVLSITHEI